jgi:MYXO-CTERM domain-containing protein
LQERQQLLVVALAAPGRLPRLTCAAGGARPGRHWLVALLLVVVVVLLQARQPLSCAEQVHCRVALLLLLSLVRCR